jgi:hypothetical protein
MNWLVGHAKAVLPGVCPDADRLRAAGVSGQDPARGKNSRPGDSLHPEGIGLG